MVVSGGCDRAAASISSNPPTQDLPGYVYPAAHTPVEQPALPRRYRQNGVGRLWQTEQFINRLHQRLLGIQQWRRNGFILWRHQQAGFIQCLTVALLALTDAVVRKRTGKKSDTAAPFAQSDVAWPDNRPGYCPGSRKAGPAPRDPPAPTAVSSVAASQVIQAQKSRADQRIRLVQHHLLTHCIARTNGEKAQRNTMVTTVIFYPQQQLRIKRQCPADIVLAVQQNRTRLILSARRREKS